MTNEQVIDCRAMEQEEFLLQSREVISSIALDTSTLRQKVYTQVSKLIKELLETNTANYNCIVLSQKSNPETEVYTLNRLQDTCGTRAHREARSLLTLKTTRAKTGGTEIKYFKVKEKGVSTNIRSIILDSFYFDVGYYNRVEEVPKHPFSERVLNLLFNSIPFQDVLKAMGGKGGTYSIICYLGTNGLNVNIVLSQNINKTKKLSELGSSSNLYGHTYYDRPTLNSLEEVIL